MSILFVLDEDKKVVPETDTLKWGKWMDAGDRRVGQTVINGKTVSTVFLGTGHSGPGLNKEWDYFFETAIISPDGEVDIIDRYKTFTSALLGHNKVVKTEEDLCSHNLSLSEP